MSNHTYLVTIGRNYGVPPRDKHQKGAVGMPMCHSSWCAFIRTIQNAIERYGYTIIMDTIGTGYDTVTGKSEDCVAFLIADMRDNPQPSAYLRNELANIAHWYRQKEVGFSAIHSNFEQARYMNINQSEYNRKQGGCSNDTNG